MITKSQDKIIEERKYYEPQIAIVRCKLREGLVIEAYDILGKILENMNKEQK